METGSQTIKGADDVRAWVSEYERGWREYDLSAVERLFTADGRYASSPVEDALVGHEAIAGIWLEEPGTEFTMTAEPVAVEGNRAVVRVDVQYTAPRSRRYRELWVLRFAGDGRVEEFEEWTYRVDEESAGADDEGGQG